MAVLDSFIQGPVDGAGKAIATKEVAVAGAPGGNAEVQGLLICDSNGRIIGETGGFGIASKYDVQPIVTDTWTAASDDVSIDVEGYGTAFVSLVGTYGAFTMLVTGDTGLNTFPTTIVGRRADTGVMFTNGTIAVTANQTVSYVIDVTGLKTLKLLAFTFPSGSCSVRAAVSAAPSPALVGVQPFGTFTVDTELAAALALADSQSRTATVPTVGAANLIDDGATLVRQRANVDGTALTSAARTSTTSSSDLTNYNGRGVVVWLNVTAVTATPLLQVNLQGKDPVAAGYTKLGADPTAIGATGVYGYEFYPGSTTAGVAGAGSVNARISALVPKIFRVIVTHGDADSATYSVGYSLIN